MKRSKKDNFFLGCSLSFAVFMFLFAPAGVRAQSSINRNLKLGDQGEDVLFLQKTLNHDAWTRISAFGPGSPGQETQFFGLKTREAVVRFQEKYASDILVPAGLIRGTGFVGALTRQKIQALSTEPIASWQSTVLPPTIPTSVPAMAANPLASLAPIASYGADTNNRNLVNLEPFLAGLARVQEKNNISGSQATQITEQIRTDAATKGDFLQEVANNERSAAERKRQQSNGFWRDILIASFKKMDPFINTARAQSPAMGGPILYYYPCTCSATTLVFVGPPSPVEYVEYVYGTQGFLSYNLPYATYMKGLYTPGSGATCYIYIGTGCSNVSSEGLIDTVVGSSPS